ncbi:uncharacterized protein KY384_002549 [Bacidia gigantensis]|uniref:uncharacterized protein n=1 Tax=Bacidia gigantensis TaxID=2732470 RepID=UPI001D03ACAE|nr:uncharacterized protein KY384_002549 [Bacidia gigantensis]KAG8532672.1 hypothetical protein KY384_002549 [Bacidia gigantensis]
MERDSIQKQKLAGRVAKRGTTSKKKHTFESFNQRIARIRIDPVRRRRQEKYNDGDVLEHGSYFKAALSEWKDCNLSESFRSFVPEVDGLCQSLPQIVHNNERLFEILLNHLKQRDVLSLEPLLDLLSQFARDLGTKFEHHFMKAVELVTSIAATHKEVEAIEWSFNSLSWIFKFLSRLLVPHLRPLFYIMAPLLGKETHKTYTTRFAAESLAFLIRKAASAYVRHPKPLQDIIQAICSDLDDTIESSNGISGIGGYKFGIMTLLFHAIKGVDRRLHAYGLRIYSCLLKSTMSEDTTGQASRDALYGTTIALIHHTNIEGLGPIVDDILNEINQLNSSSTNVMLDSLTHLLFLVSAVRKGSRIGEWHNILDASLTLLRCSMAVGTEQTLRVFEMAALIFQTAPLEVVLPYFNSAMTMITTDDHEQIFLSFCNSFSDTGEERFHELLMPHFERFVALKWKDKRLQLLLLINKLAANASQRKFEIPDAWQEHMLEQSQKLPENTEEAVEIFHTVTSLQFMSMSNSIQKNVVESLGIHIDHCLSEDRADSTPNFTVISFVKQYLNCNSGKITRFGAWWSALCRDATKYSTQMPYLEAMLSLSNIRNESAEFLNSETLIDQLMYNLQSSSSALRLVSLKILDSFGPSDGKKRAHFLSSAIAIEETPLGLQSARSVAVRVRTLASDYKTASTDRIFRQAFPHFCFGMLTYKLAQAQEAALEALREICEIKVGEDIVSTVVFEWLAKPRPESSSNKAVNTDKMHLELPNWSTEFECSNVKDLMRLLKRSRSEVKDAPKLLKESYYADSAEISREVPDAHYLALKVLLTVPCLVERSSGRLVPHFLSWAADVNPGDTNCEVTSSWPSRERKIMVNIFAKCSWPQNLYMADRVLHALTQILACGDTEFQKTALQAIFNWKFPEIVPYKENLLNLLDEARLRDEITAFLSGDGGISVRQDHRAKVMPILLRLLYGLMIVRTGSKGARGNQSSRRKAILQAVSNLGAPYFAEYLHIALEGLWHLELVDGKAVNEAILEQQIIPPRKQIGVLNMIKTFLEVLGSDLLPCARSLIEATLYCGIRAARLLESSRDGERQGPDAASCTSLLKDVRQTSMNCLVLIASRFSPQTLEPYVSTTFRHILSCRLENLAVESSQSISGILQLFATWAKSLVGVHFLLDFDQRTLESVSKIPLASSCKDEVVVFIIDDILMHILHALKATTSESDGKIATASSTTLRVKFLGTYTDCILYTMAHVLETNSNKLLLDVSIQVVAEIASLVENSSASIRPILALSIQLLGLPSHRIGPKSKGELLRIVERFLKIDQSQMPKETWDCAFKILSSLFGYFKDRESRQRLCKAFSALLDEDLELAETASICEKLNAFSDRKIGEPDFDTRLKAFNLINEFRWQDLSAKSWTPLLYNMLFFVRDEEELALRSSAGLSLRRFVKAASLDDGTQRRDLCELSHAVLLPALRKGAFATSELVRSEYIGIMAFLVRENPSWSEISDMRPLLMDNDDEASVFSNILHIQQHRRIRALRRLAACANQCLLRSHNVSQFLIPLIEHFIFDATGDDAGNDLSGEASTAIAEVASSLEWPQYKAVFRRYSSYLVSKPDALKKVTRLLSLFVGTLMEAAKARQKEEEGNVPTVNPLVACDTSRLTTLSKTLPKTGGLAGDIVDNLLPPLTSFVHDKDEARVSLRVSVAVALSKLLTILPHIHMDSQLPSILTDVCNILRSRAQDSRDLSRKSLAEMLLYMGPRYFSFALRELRGALARGYQLHVLSYTVHSLLVTTSSVYAPGDLDYCLPQIVRIMMDDIFGSVGQEKDAEEYISRMKEVRGSKALDSMELAAKLTSVTHLGNLIKPLEAMLGEKHDVRTTNKVNELFRRISAGLAQNKAIEDQRVLVFCHEILLHGYKSRASASAAVDKDEAGVPGFASSHKTANKRMSHDLSTSPKLVSFALDVLRMILHKHNNLQTPTNLHGFMPLIGDAITTPTEEIQIAALRLLTAIIKVPLKAIDDNTNVYFMECVKIIRSSSSTTAELAQAAYKLISTILQEKQPTDLREGDLAFLLKRLIPDLEEPSKQGSAFKFLKAIMSYRAIVPEVYEVMDLIRTMLVTNPTQDVRDQARGVYVQFFTNYPQSKDRFSKQINFLINNLDYKHMEGRISVLELINVLLIKMEDSTSQQMLGSLFGPLVMVIINDESDKCREIASLLLHTLFKCADPERKQLFLNTMSSWLNQAEEPLLHRAAFQTFCIYLDTNCSQSERQIRRFQPQLTTVLEAATDDATRTDWQLLYVVLQTISKICHHLPALAFTTSFAPVWSKIRHCLSYPHSWIKLSAAKLMGAYFTNIWGSDVSDEGITFPVKGATGLSISEDEVVEIVQVSLSSLQGSAGCDELANQCVRNLLFLGRLMIRTSLIWPELHPGTQNGCRIGGEGSCCTDSDDENSTQQPKQKLAITYMTQQVSRFLRRPPSTTRASSLTPLKSSLQLLALITKYMSVPMLCAHMATILLPLYQMTNTNSTIPFSTDAGFTEDYGVLVSNVGDLMSNLQDKVGTTAYVEELQRIIEIVRRKREARRAKRAIERVAFPEQAGRQKRRKSDKKKEKRKERSSGHRALRRGW